MARPKGSIGQKPWRDALKRAAKRREEGKGSPQWLDRMADACVEKGAKGDVAAMKEYGDRVEGKPAQAIEVGVTVAITAIERRIVDPLSRVEVVEAERIEQRAEDGENG